MARYRKRPVIVQAEQFFEGADAWPEGVIEIAGDFFIETLEGMVTVSEGDWIITGVRGERYPCKPDIFMHTYERVDE